MVFKPGASGNPGGRHKSKLWLEALNMALKAKGTDSTGTAKLLRDIADKVVDMAVEGDLGAITEIANRLDGKPVQAVSGEDGMPIEMTIRWSQAEGQKKPDPETEA